MIIPKDSTSDLMTKPRFTSNWETVLTDLWETWSVDNGIQAAQPVRAPKGPDSFVLTYKFYET